MTDSDWQRRYDEAIAEEQAKIDADPLKPGAHLLFTVSETLALVAGLAGGVAWLVQRFGRRRT